MALDPSPRFEPLAGRTHHVLEFLQRVLPALVRSQFWPGQNLPYDVFMAAVIRTFGTSEIALRLPSLLATALTAWLLFRLAEHFLDREAGVLVVVVFVSLHEIAKQAAANARPYAIALLLVVASVLQLVRWLSQRKLSNMLGFVFATAAIPYFHFLFATTYPALLAYAIYTRRSDRRVRIRELVAAATIIMLLLLPLAADAIHSHRLSSASSWAGTPDASQLVSSFVPVALASGLLIGALIGCFASRTVGFITTNIPRRANFLFIALLLTPIAVLFLFPGLAPSRSLCPGITFPVSSHWL